MLYISTKQYKVSLLLDSAKKVFGEIFKKKKVFFYI